MSLFANLFPSDAPLRAEKRLFQDINLLERPIGSPVGDASETAGVAGVSRKSKKARKERVSTQPLRQVGTGRRASREDGANLAAQSGAAAPDTRRANYLERMDKGPRAAPAKQALKAQDEDTSAATTEMEQRGRAEALAVDSMRGRQENLAASTIYPELALDGRQGASFARKAPSGGSDMAELERTIFVGNVPADVNLKHLKKLFAEFGKIESVRLRGVPVDLDSKMPRGLQIKAGKADAKRCPAVAYVRFADAAATRSALSKNMVNFQGHHLRVDFATAPSSDKSAVPAQYDKTRSVFVGNLPPDVQEEDLIGKFNVGDEESVLEGSVEAVRVVRDARTNMGRGIAFVLFNNRLAVLAALNLNGSVCCNREIRVSRVKAAASSGGTTGAAGLGARAARGSTGVARRLRTQGAAPVDGENSNATHREGFLGVKTKGRNRGTATEGSFVGKTARIATSTVSTGPNVTQTTTQKRPAVAARKARQLMAAGRLSGADAKALRAAQKKRSGKVKSKRF